MTFLIERVRTDEIPTVPEGPARLARAWELGLKRTPQLIEQCLVSLAAGIESRRGIYHGDLHCGNVMVRRQDAIVIDFGSMCDFGPLSADPALLEVSMVFGTDEDDDPEPAAFKEWREFVQELYRRPRHPPAPGSEHFRYSWLQKAVREIRHIGLCCEISREEALIVLTGCLLRFARLSKSDLPTEALVRLSEDRRAYALVVAENLCSMISDDHAQS